MEISLALFCYHPPIIIRHTFIAAERLKLKKLINQLFNEGKVLNLYPIRLLYAIDKEQLMLQHQAFFTVAKKRCKSAVVRNKLKRRMREAHRLHKYRLGTPIDAKQRFLIGYIYVGDPRAGDFHTIQKKVIKALEFLAPLADESLQVLGKLNC